MGRCRLKLIESWDSGLLVEHVLSTFDLMVFKIILEVVIRSQNACTPKRADH